MKRIILLRHASADLEAFNQDSDHKKPIDNKGENECKNLALWLKNNFIEFDLIISSNAKRALQTCELVFEAHSATLQKNPSFYLCNSEEIIMAIQKINDEVKNVVIVGHEPSISDTMRVLSGSTRPDLKKYLNISYQPCTICFLYFNLKSWKSLKKKDGVLEGYLSPDIVNLYNEKS